MKVNNKTRTALFFFVLCLLGFAAVFFWTRSSLSAWDEELSSLSNEADSLAAYLSELEENNALADQSSILEVAGMDEARKASDDEAASAFFDLCLTWDSYETYTAARETAVSEYSIPEDSRFLTLFFPDVVVAGPTADGTTYNRIDMYDLNMSYEGMASYVSAVDGDIYSYIAFVDTASRDQYGNEALNRVMFLYDIDASGRFFNVDAYTMTE